MSEHTAENVGAPVELVTSEVAARNFRVSWRPAPGKVDKYRVVYHAAHGGEPHEVLFFFMKKNKKAFEFHKA